MSVHIYWHPSSLEHNAGPGHPESPARLRAVLDRLHDLERSVPLTWWESAPASAVQLERVHPARYLDGLRRMAERGGGALDGDTSMCAASYSAAVHAAGAAASAAGAALGHGAPCFVPVRPPGHHATSTVAMGFCLINNVVVAAREAIEAHGAERVLIVDWDVHHGNGTQDLVEHDARIRYLSLHQWPLYPGTGRAEERGVGNVFNIPRPPGLPRDRYVADLLDGVAQATSGWQPDLLLVSAGFDAMAGDPLAGFTLEPEDYAAWIEALSRLGAPLVAVLEGGYAPDRIAAASAATVRAMAALG